MTKPKVELYPQEYRDDLTKLTDTIDWTCFDHRALPLVAICTEWRSDNIATVWTREDLPHGVAIDALRAALRELEGA